MNHSRIPSMVSLLTLLYFCLKPFNAQASTTTNKVTLNRNNPNSPFGSQPAIAAQSVPQPTESGFPNPQPLKLTPPEAHLPDWEDDVDVILPEAPASLQQACTSLKNLNEDLQTILGIRYQEPKLPTQNALDYALTDISVGRTPSTYVSGLIANGTFGIAYNGPNKDLQLEGKLASSISELTTALDLLDHKHNAATKTLLVNQRKSKETAINNILTILYAIAPYPEKRVPANILEASLKTIERMRTNAELHQLLFNIEYFAYNDHLIELSKALKAVHNNPAPINIPPAPNSETLINMLNQYKREELKK